MVNIIKKSEKARLTTSKFDGVLKPFVEENIYTTMPFPQTEMNPSTPTMNPRMPCHRGFKGGNWYQ